MKTKISFIILFAVAAIAVAISKVDNSNTNGTESKTNSDTLITGKELFRMNCAGCHGLDRKGIPPSFPSLIGVKEKITKDAITNQIRNGKGIMPAMKHLSEKEIDAILAVLYDEPLKAVSAINLTPVSIGKNFFVSNCSSCHRATTNDPAPQNANTQMCAMMEPAVLAGVTKRFTNEEFINILNTGPCYMPSFDFLNAKDKDALWAFFKTLEGKGEPEGKTMGQMCPMMKGMSDMDMEKNTSVSDNTAKMKTDNIYYTCSMHPEIKQDKAGNCPKCGMKLEKVESNKPQKKQKMKMNMMCPMMKSGKSCCGM